MYTPAAFRERDPDWILGFVEANEFGLLVSQDPLQASHLPFTLQRPEEPETPARLLCHMARANPQWRAFAQAGGAPALVVFRGAHAYVSPSWYGSGPAVPTWNYDAVHAEGVVELVEDPLAVAAQMKAMAARYEPTPGFDLDALPEEYVKARFSELMGLSMTVTRWIAKRKQSQNRPAADRPAVAEALEARGEVAAAEALRAAPTRR
jgi:transcriptional regulator